MVTLLMQTSATPSSTQTAAHAPHPRTVPSGNRTAVPGRLTMWALTALCLCLPLALPSIATAQGELLSGMEGIGGHQVGGLVYDKVVITYNGNPVIKSRLRLRDRGAKLRGEVNGMSVEGECRTVNGFNMDIQCRLYRAGANEQVAYLHIPLL